MASKTISLKEETYHRLVRIKGNDESFSDVIDRLVGADDQPLERLVGILSPEQVTALRERSGAFRDHVDARMRPDGDR